MRPVSMAKDTDIPRLNLDGNTIRANDCTTGVPSNFCHRYLNRFICSMHFFRIRIKMNTKMVFFPHHFHYFFFYFYSVSTISLFSLPLFILFGRPLPTLLFLLIGHSDKIIHVLVSLQKYSK